MPILNIPYVGGSAVSVGDMSVEYAGQARTGMFLASRKMSFPKTVSNSLCRSSLVVQTSCCIICPGGRSQMLLQVKKQDMEVLSCGSNEAVRMYYKILRNDTGNDLW